MNTDRTPNPNVPPTVADAFVAYMRNHDFILDYSMRSLTDMFDRILDLPLLQSNSVLPVMVHGDEMQFDINSAASAYLGETISRIYDGTWAGHFNTESIVNFYTSKITFGDYCLNPIAWLSYRVKNGREEGSVEDWLSRVTPSFEARKDLTPKTGFIEDIY